MNSFIPLPDNKVKTIAENQLRRFYKMRDRHPNLTDVLRIIL